jgi:hypothetical protein
VHYFPYAACRSMHIDLSEWVSPQVPVGGQVTYQQQSKASATVLVADPRYYQTIAFPDKGSVTMATSCGADSTTQDAGLPDVNKYLDTLATAAQGVLATTSKQNSSGATAPKKPGS